MALFIIGLAPFFFLAGIVQIKIMTGFSGSEALEGAGQVTILSLLAMWQPSTYIRGVCTGRTVQGPGRAGPGNSLSKTAAGPGRAQNKRAVSGRSETSRPVLVTNSIDSGDFSQAPPKQSAVCSTCITRTNATRELSVYLDGQRLRHECRPTYLGVTRPYAVLQRTLDKGCSKLKKRNNLLIKLAGSTLGANTAVIFSGALLFSSRVLCPSVVTLCSHRSGRCAVELYHASHLGYPPFYTSPMASSALQH